MLIVAASIFNVILSYVFGNNGYEAFITLSIALGILITWQSLQLARHLFQSKTWLIIKLLGLVLLGFFWFIVIAGVMLSVSGNAYDPTVSVPNVNWLIVIIGTGPYLLPQLSFYKIKVGFHKTATGMLTTLYSVMVLFIAALGFYNNQAKYQGLVLVLAIQLQYLMNHVIIRTDYLNRSHATATNIARRLKINGNDLGQNLTIFLVGLPFFMPLMIVLLVSSIN